MEAVGFYLWLPLFKIKLSIPPMPPLLLSSNGNDSPFYASYTTIFENLYYLSKQYLYKISIGSASQTH